MIVDTDVAVVGAGPAGARAAELLASGGLRVALFDPRVPWEKPCGGGLTAAAFRHVPELGGIEPFVRRIDRIRLEADDIVLHLGLDHPLRVVSRTALGLWQLDRALAAGAVLEPVAVRHVCRDESGCWKLEFADGGSLQAKYLVGADGAASVVRRAVAARLRIELDPARVAFAPGAGATPEEIGFRFIAGVTGYAWDFPRPDHRSIGMGVTPGTWGRRRMDEEIDRYWTELGGCRCVGAVWAGAVIGTAGRMRPRDYHWIGGDDFALLGDAAGLADPATGEGMLNAMRSAGMLAESFDRDRSFAGYPRLVAHRLEPEFRTARRVQRLLYGGGLARRLIGLAPNHRGVRTLLTAIVNDGNEHDVQLGRRLLQVLLGGSQGRRGGILQRPARGMT